MKSTVHISGEGKTEKVIDENSITLTAIPDVGWTFKHFVNGESTFTDNPYTLESTEDVEITAAFYVTIEDYLIGLVGFDVNEIALNSIRVFREIEKNSDVSELSMKDKELLYADLLMWAASSPTSYTGSKDSDGGWTHTEAGKTISVTDKKRFENTAKSIYKKYQDKKYNSGIKLVNLW
ncbi:hypothetical protein CLV62_12063 [Dysgonomonas alginatilytica]|uniref:Bacterial repeat domain-containing protein n=1 Tax=Dysgonomonas alginatilytica TaxID=1605892 RepID=A0A2V3PKY2_9BACT|nr:hypothetical protein [Dysgonomonas alginatilytica]PXV62374.1 hypothetical protein CLV62_12063 [Dysgonomonas alginatilytica]